MGLGLEFVPFGRALAGWAMTLSWGEGVVGASARTPTPPCNPAHKKFMFFFLPTDNYCPSHLIPTKKLKIKLKFRLYTWRLFVHKSQIECTSP